MLPLNHGRTSSSSVSRTRRFDSDLRSGSGGTCVLICVTRTETERERTRSFGGSCFWVFLLQVVLDRSRWVNVGGYVGELLWNTGELRTPTTITSDWVLGCKWERGSFRGSRRRCCPDFDERPVAGVETC